MTVNDKQRDEKRARAKRADLDAMQERFDAIISVIGSVSGVNLSESNELAINLINRLAGGDSLDDIIQEAGRAALGLSND
jgi:hypothetical protein